MPNTSSAGNVEQNGLQRLNPRQIAIKLISVAGVPPVRILDATDEQFEAFIKQVGIIVKTGDEGEKWSFDNRCRAINFALKHGRELPFVEPETERKTIPDAPSESAPQQGMIDIPNAPIVSGWANILKATLQNNSPEE